MVSPPPSNRCKECRTLHESLCRSVTEPTYLYHSSFAKLQQAAASGCDLCQYIRAVLIIESPSFYGLCESTDPVYALVRPDRLNIPGDPIRLLDVRIGCGIFGWDKRVAYLQAVLPPREADHQISEFSSNVREDLQSAKKWLSACLQDHRRCFLQHPAQRPSRLLCVAQDEQPTSLYRLVDTSELKEMTYCALSYCWGDEENPLRLTSQNGSRLRAGIDSQELPPTIQDAITITRSLGVSYLWVDRLCIVQPHKSDTADWLKESAKMGDIYRGALCTISATSARSSTEGCLLPKEWKRYPVKTCELAIGFMLPQPLPFDASRTQAPLYNRGWTLQEQYLSSRVLYFTKDALCWQCKTCRHASETLREEHLDLERKPSPFDESKQLLSEAQLDHLPFGGATGLLRQWTGIVADFSQRHFRVPSDKLIAFSSIAKLFQGAFKTQYLAGLWRSMLLGQLLWCCSQRWKPSDGTYHMSLIPSWSWASRSSHQKVDWFQSYLSPMNPIDGVAVDHKRTFTTLSTPDPTGPVRGGQVCLRAPLVELWLDLSTARDVDSKDDRTYQLISPPAGKDAGVSIWWDEPRQDIPKTLSCLFLTCASRGFHGLIIEPADKKSKTVKRVGKALLLMKMWHHRTDIQSIDPYIARYDTFVIV